MEVMRKLIGAKLAAAVVTAALAISLVPVLCAQEENVEADEAVDDQSAIVGRPVVPNFSLNNLDGEQVQLSDYAGQVVVVNFWATWCVPCLQELPFLQDYYTEFEDQGLVVLAISRDGPETFSQVRRVARRYRWTMPVLLDQEGSAAALVNPRDATPYTLFIDRTGRLAYEHEGYTPGVETEYRDHLIELLAAPEP
jgi:peroxiredoxin